MLEKYDASQYIMKPPYFDAFQPRDSTKRRKYAKRQPISAYYAGEKTVPVNVAPEMLHKKRAERFGNIGKELGLDINLHFNVASFPFTDPHTGKEKLSPVHLFTSFRQNDMSVAGPWCPSLGSPVMMQEGIPFDMKESFVKESIFHLQEEYDAVVLGIPIRKEGSATDAIFMDHNLGGVAFSHPDFIDITYYFYPGNFQNKANDLLLDKDFYRIINAIEATRRKNFNEYKAMAAKNPTRQNDSKEVADYLHFLFQIVLNQA